MLQSIKVLADDMGPGALEDHLELIIVFIEQLLDKTHVC